MKTSLHKKKPSRNRTLLFLLLGILSSATAQNVSFAPVGAEWYYGYQDIMDKGFVKITAVNDTVIEGRNCVVLEKNRTGYGNYSGLHSDVFGYEYMTVSDDCVLVYRNGSFHQLFDFGAEVGDSWTIPGWEGLCDEDYGTVKMVEKGTATINNVNLRYIRIVDGSDSYWGFSTNWNETERDTITVFERIGPMGTYLLPEQKCLFDNAEGGELRCYFDDVVGHFKDNNSYYSDRNCDYINEQYQEVDELETNNVVAVFPNPVGDCLDIQFSPDVNPTRVELYDVQGRLVLSQESNLKSVSTANLPAGVYSVKVTLSNGKSYSDTVIKK